ncbi:unnamed protein product, partial [Mesorhabditis spiculigera]
MLPSKLFPCLLVIYALNGVFVQANNATTLQPKPRCPAGNYVCLGKDDAELCMPGTYGTVEPTPGLCKIQWAHGRRNTCRWGSAPIWLFNKHYCVESSKLLHSYLPYNWTMAGCPPLHLNCAADNATITHCVNGTQMSQHTYPAVCQHRLCLKPDHHACRGPYGIMCIPYGDILEIKSSNKENELDECIMERPTEPPAMAEGDEKTSTQSKHGNALSILPALLLTVLVLKAFG